MNNRPLVSVVVVTLERLDILLSAVESLSKQSYPNLELIVVDNGSNPGSRISAAVQERYPRVTCLRLERNLGFAGGNNHGIRATTGSFVALLNNDAVADPDWIESMLSLAEADPTIGAVGSVVRDGNFPGKLDSCGVGVALDGMSRQLLNGEPESAAPTGVMDLMAISGCGCLFRRKALDSVGLFDERYFAYCEDTDLSLRVGNAGWRLVLAPGARITHFYSRTSGPYSLRKLLWIERNHYWVAVGNFHWLLVLALPLTTVGRYAIQVYALLRGKSSVSGFVDGGGLLNVVKVLIGANVEMWRGLPGSLQLRWTHPDMGKRNSWAGLKCFLDRRMTLVEIILGRPVNRTKTNP
jgi:GT2 family glycosyltransferase